MNSYNQKENYLRCCYWRSTTFNGSKACVDNNSLIVQLHNVGSDWRSRRKSGVQGPTRVHSDRGPVIVSGVLFFLYASFGCDNYPNFSFVSGNNLTKNILWQLTHSNWNGSKLVECVFPIYYCEIMICIFSKHFRKVFPGE